MTVISPLMTTQVPRHTEAMSEKPDLRAAAEAFEAVFLEQLIREGRDSGFGPSLLSSKEGDTFRQMLDAEQAKAGAGRVNLGIADALYAQLSPSVKE